ncbi:MAG: class I SAM-dependent methyltransferase [Kouleothrix sp.]|nr:class I SAM-dependent methyltransferase [Kouleothrix sp.]
MIYRAPPISYDDVPYRSRSLPSTAPNHLATLAALFGMRPAPATQCRVLELGCAGGGNLIPLAYALPESSFVGIDLSAHQIAIGQTLVDELGLGNIALEHGNILDIGAELGRFDYIIVYGIYSWVPREVQEKILAICKRHLASNGVAFVSYNTYPGWHIRGIARDMMLYHSQHFETNDQRISQARAVVDFMAEATAKLGANDARIKLYSQLLEQEREQIHAQPDFYLAHEHLSEVNDPIYFAQFVERAAQHGLQYLSDARLSTMLVGLLPADIAETLEGIAPHSIAVEQFMDFLYNRTFRQTLLCHDDVPLRRDLAPQQMLGFQVASAARPVAPGEPEFSPTLEKFRTPSGSVISAKSPLSSAALRCLADRWPQALSFDDLLAAALARAGSPPEDAVAAERLADLVLTCYSTDVVELRVHTPPFVLEAGERPTASRLARLQARRDGVVTNLCHESVALDPACEALMPYLDGQHNRAALRAVLEQLIAEGALELDPGDDLAHAAAVAELLKDSLQKLARGALLLS